MSKLLSDAQISRRKKIQGNISIAGGTLGLTALGLRGAGAARGAGRVGRTAQKFTKITPNKAASDKLKDASTAVTTAGAGLGGVGAFNFASYTKAEARKRQPLKKGLDMMDFGLGGVQSEISKAMPMPKVPGVKPMNPVMGAKPAFNVKPMAMPKPMGAPQTAAPKNFGQATSTYRQPGPGAPTGKTMPGAQPGRHRQQGGMLSRLSTTQKVGVAAGGAGAGGLAGGMALGQQRPKRQQFGKASDWQNITEHERRARDSRRSYRRGQNTAGVGGAAITTSAVLAGARGEDWGNDIHRASTQIKNTAKYHYGDQKMGKPMRKVARRALVRGLKGNPAGTMALAGGTAMAAGGATMVGARINEKRHDRAISQLRRKRVTKSADDLVFKAYDPERNRQRRMDYYQIGTAAGSGALAAGAGMQTKSAVTNIRAARTAGREAGKIKLDEGHTPAPNFTKGEAAATAEHNMKAAAGNAKKAGLLRDSLKSYKQGARHGAKAAGLGAAAIGAAVASDRIRSYKNGKGRSYGSLRMISNS